MGNTNTLDHEAIEAKYMGKGAKMYDEFNILKKRLLARNLFAILALFAFILWSWKGTGFKAIYFIRGLKNIYEFIFHDLLPPDLSVFPGLIRYALDSFYIAYVDTSICVVFSIIFGFLAAKNTTLHPLLGNTFRALITFIRAIPSMVVGIFFVGALGLGAVTGTVAIAISSIGFLAKGYADSLEEIDPGQVEAVRATGAGWFQIMTQAVWPQFYPSFVSWSFYQMDLNVRNSSILGLIGAGGLGIVLLQHIKLFQYKSATTAILMTFLTINVVEYITAKVREKVL